MSVNLVIWSWSEGYETAAKRRKHKLKFDAIKEVWAETGNHLCMGAFDFKEFEAAVVAKLGPQVVDGPYILERYRHSLCYNLPMSAAHTLIPVIGTIARRFGLNAAEC
jgi:hypothetical protein